MWAGGHVEDAEDPDRGFGVLQWGGGGVSDHNYLTDKHREKNYKHTKKNTG